MSITTGGVAIVPRRHATLIVAVVLAVAGVGVAALPVTAAAQTSTVVTMFSDAGEYVGAGKQRLFHPGNGSVTLSGDAGYLGLSVSGGWFGDYYTLIFAAPPGQTLHPGLYLRAQRAAFRQAGRPGIDVSGSGRGCNQVEGRFDVKDIAVGTDGTVQRLWLTYEQHCEGQVPALWGEVRYRSPVSDSDPVVAPAYAWWPDIDLGSGGTTIPITVEALAAPATIARVTVTGAHREDFQIKADECSGLALGPGDLCKVFVRFFPKRAGPRIARLVIAHADSTRHRIQLDGLAIGGRTQFLMDSEPGDYIGQGQQYAYTPSNASIAVDGGRTHIGGVINGADGNWWSVDFDAPSGEIFTAGTTYAADRSSSLGSAGMYVSGAGRACNQVEGEFTITHLTVNPDESLRSVGVDFEQHCEGFDPALFGTLDYRVPIGETEPPGKVTGLEVSRNGATAELSWTNPTAGDLALISVRYLQGDTPPGAPNSGYFGYVGKRQTVLLRGLDGNRPLALALFSVDRNGNVSQPLVAVIPPD
jgi:hypothetical protein